MAGDPMTDPWLQGGHGRYEGQSLPKYLYLKAPGSRWQLADDVDIVELRRQLANARFGTVQTHVIVDGQRGPFSIRPDQMHPHAVVDAAGARPTRSAGRRWTRSRSIPAGRAVPTHDGLSSPT